MLGCALSVVFNCILGAVWYSGKVPTGRLWMRRVYPGKSESDISKESGFAIAFSIIASIILSLLLRFILIDFFKSSSLIDGVKFGVGLSCLTTLLEAPHVLFGKGYFDVFLIHQVYNLLTVAVGAVCIVYFN
ncbi:hypothetical protein Bpfe_000464 [Biomphalaria pfeifferi]|uniref:DUF1761 domain-containing protein n=1 Tax=Biomphalaria pfeifferi TaxID=112525 RepID=A0AAD8CCH6_BIOPF|nr:hypothetical protein Bpfe_000464 [Biomphalaria pfeifferi]